MHSSYITFLLLLASGISWGHAIARPLHVHNAVHQKRAKNQKLPFQLLTAFIGLLICGFPLSCCIPIISPPPRSSLSLSHALLLL